MMWGAAPYFDDVPTLENVGLNKLSQAEIIEAIKSVFFFYNSRSLFNVYSIGNPSSMVFQPSSFPVSFTSTSQVFKKASSSLFIPPYVLIYPFC